MTPKLFSELGLSAEVLKAIDKLGFEQAAPIQAEAIPVLMQGKDVVGQSQTGSGKTAAFAIPAIEKTDPNKRAVQVLILCPTRELAVQVSEEVHKLAIFKRGIHALPIYGGQSYERQFLGLKQGAQIVIGTPGRVMDHMRRGTMRLDALKMVILDEVDVMLNMGFRDDIEVILQAAPKERQTVFFSATIPRPIADLIQKYSRDPQNVRIEQKALTVPTVEQVYYEVDRRYKIDLLTKLIDIHDLRLGIIFCNTKRMVDDLVDHLNAQGYSADRLHGDMNQAQRDRVMNKFRKSGLEFLVATDVAARGIDVDDVQVVFNYDLPYDVEDYVHRIGRTGRAGRSGRAVSFVAGRELFQIRNIERYMNARIHRGRIPSHGDVEEARSNQVLDKLRATLQGGEFKRQDHLIERLLEEGFSSTDIASALLHQMQGGGSAPVAKAPPVEARPGAERVSLWQTPETRSDARTDRPPPAPVRQEVSASRPQPPAVRPPTPLRPVVASQKVEPRKIEPPRPQPSVPAIAKPVPAKPVKAPTPAPKPAQLVAPKTQVAPSVTAVERPVVAPIVPIAGAPVPAPVSERVKPVKKIEVRAEPEAVATNGRANVAPPVEPSVAPAADPAVANGAKPSRPTAKGQTRLHVNAGEEMGFVEADVVNAIMGVTGLPAKVVGVVDIRARHAFVDVVSDYANGIIAKLNRAEIKGRKLKVKLA